MHGLLQAPSNNTNSSYNGGGVDEDFSPVRVATSDTLVATNIFGIADSVERGEQLKQLSSTHNTELVREESSEESDDGEGEEHKDNFMAHMLQKNAFGSSRQQSHRNKRGTIKEAHE